MRVVYKAFHKLDILIKRTEQLFRHFRYSAVFVSTRKSLPDTRRVQRKLQSYSTY